MSRLSLKLSLLSAFLLVACSDKDDGASAGDPGQATGPCIQGQCFPGLLCVVDKCINAGGPSSGSGPGSGGSNSEGSSDGTTTSEPVTTTNSSEPVTSTDAMTSNGPTTNNTGEMTITGATSDDTTTPGTTTPGTTTTGNTSETTGSTTGTTGSTTGTTGSTTGTTNYGNCGWDAGGSYYNCSPSGVPGMADPSNTYPIDCPPVLPNPGEACDENGQPGYAGCCAEGGILFFCEGSVIQGSQCQ